MRPRSKTCVPLLLALAAFPAAAIDGDLDPAFFGAGQLVIGGATSTIESREVVVAPDDRFVFAWKSSADETALAWRRTSSSVLYSACTTLLTGEEVGSIEGLAFDPQGRLVVGATVRLATPGADWTGAVFRFLYPNCTLDAAFGGGDGRVDLSWNLYDDIRLRGLATRSDSSIAVAAAAEEAGDSDVAIFVLTTNGTLDPLFSTDGRAVWSNAGSLEPSAIVLAPGGDLLVAGTLDDPYSDFALAQFAPTGSLRSWVRVAFDLVPDADDHCYAAALLADGRVALVGSAALDALHANVAVALLRADPSGLYFNDPTFDGDGTRTFSFGLDLNSARAVVAQGDDKIVVAGWTESSSLDAEFAVARLRTDGGLDSSFGASGRRRVDPDIGGSLHDRAYAVALDHGRILLVGSAAVTSSHGVALVRLQNAYLFADGFDLGTTASWSPP